MKITIARKMLFGFGSVALIALLLGGFGFWGLLRLSRTLDNFGQNRIPDLQALAILNTQRMAIRAQTLDIWVEENSGHDAAVAAYRRIQVERAASWTAVDAAWQLLQTIPRHDDRGRQLVANLETEYRQWREHYVELDGLISRFVVSSNDQERALLYPLYRDAVARMIPVSDRMGDLFVQLTNNNTSNTNRMIAESIAVAIILERTSLILALFGVVLAAVIGFIISRGIVVPVKNYVALTGLLAVGDFSAEVSQEFQERGDEIGDLGRSFHTMIGSIRNLIARLSENANTVASSATELSAISTQTADSVQTMSTKTGTLAAAAEESSTNTTSVAASMEQASTSLASVASATEQMSATIGEIASNSEKAQSISRKAGEQAESAAALMAKLGQAAHEIGQVTETITEISSQTNLLALNATIEAARAGSAGKGFAVVAGEIKELARQTAAATEDIKHKIDGVQSSTGSVMADIEKINGVIRDVGLLVSSIAAAIEEQATVTRDVAGNIAQASAGVQEANERVSQTAAVSRTIAQDIAGVDAAAGEIRDGGAQVEASAAELSKLAEKLLQMVGEFKV